VSKALSPEKPVPNRNSRCCRRGLSGLRTLARPRNAELKLDAILPNPALFLISSVDSITVGSFVPSFFDSCRQHFLQKNLFQTAIEDADARIGAPRDLWANSECQIQARRYIAEIQFALTSTENPFPERPHFRHF
jgi:hypothetical protein